MILGLAHSAKVCRSLDVLCNCCGYLQMKQAELDLSDARRSNGSLTGRPLTVSLVVPGVHCMSCACSLCI
jgi:hypothetical protein